MGHIALNEWSLYDDLGKYGEILTTTSDKDRHFIMVPWEENNGNFRLGELIDVTFLAGTLGVRFMDIGGNNEIFNALVDIYEDYRSQKEPCHYRLEFFRLSLIIYVCHEPHMQKIYSPLSEKA